MHEHVNGISRRDLFKFGGIAAAGVVGAGALASCAPQGAGAAGSASAASTTDEATTAAGHLRTGMPSFLTAPEAIADVKETKDYDVVVIGAGASGVPAALSAFEAGAKVALLQKESQAIAQGNSGSGIDLATSDPADIANLVSQLIADSQHRPNRELVELWAQNSGEAVKWVIEKSLEGGAQVIDQGNLQHMPLINKKGYNINFVTSFFGPKPYNTGDGMRALAAIGAAEGVLRICKICDVPAVIAVKRDATLAGSLIDALCRAGQKDDFIDPKDALPIISKRTLCVVVDTYQVGLVESKEILEKCGKVAVIDHHRKGVGYIQNPDLVCHEPYSSSASELVTELLQYVGDRDDKPNRVEAEGLLSGILLDTQDFTLHTGVRTFEAAAALRRYGAETERVRQLFDVTMVEYAAKAELVERARMYRNCAISVGGEIAPEARVAIAQAANDLLRIQGVDASFVAVQVGTGVNISARSLGAVNVQVIMEALGGGGHQTMAAAQLKHITPEAARSRIETAIDNYWASQKKSGAEEK